MSETKKKPPTPANVLEGKNQKTLKDKEKAEILANYYKNQLKTIAKILYQRQTITKN